MTPGRTPPRPHRHQHPMDVLTGTAEQPQHPQLGPMLRCGPRRRTARGVRIALSGNPDLTGAGLRIAPGVCALVGLLVRSVVALVAVRGPQRASPLWRVLPRCSHSAM